MSTYTGDATITDVISASASATNQASVVAYTCPAGRFAEVQLITCSGSSTNNGVQCGGNIGSVSIVADITNDSTTTTKTIEDFPINIIINEGQVVEAIASQGSGSISVTIKEYNKP